MNDPMGPGANLTHRGEIVERTPAARWSYRCLHAAPVNRLLHYRGPWGSGLADRIGSEPANVTATP
jgi:hypothetical protein